MPQDNTKKQQTCEIVKTYGEKVCSQEFYKTSSARQASEQLKEIKLAELVNFRAYHVSPYNTKEVNFYLKF